MTNDDGNPLGVMMFIAFGVAMGCVLTLAFNGCVRDPTPAVVGLNMVRCSVCHFDRVPALNTAKKYRTHHQKRSLKKVDNAQEQAYLDKILTGDKP